MRAVSIENLQIGKHVYFVDPSGHNAGDTKVGRKKVLLTKDSLGGGGGKLQWRSKPARVNTSKSVTGASNAANGLKLQKNLATRSQFSEAGTTTAGRGSKDIFRNAGQSAKRYGGNSADYVKKSSSQFKASDGYKFETHWIENLKTGKRFEPKTIIEFNFK